MLIRGAINIYVKYVSKVIFLSVYITNLEYLLSKRKIFDFWNSTFLLTFKCLATIEKKKILKN